MTTSGVPEAQHTLITGGAGFIGSHLAGRLLDQGGRIVVIDDFSTGSRDNLTQLADNPRLTIIEDDVTHCPALGQLVADSDYVFHLAAAVGVDLVVQSPIRTIETNLKSTEAILEAAAPNLTPLLLPSSGRRYCSRTGIGGWREIHPPRATLLRSDKHSQKVTKRGVVSDKKVRTRRSKVKISA